MDDGTGKPTGRNFYKAKGLHGVSLRVPKETSIKLKVYASRLRLPLYETVQSILDHFLENPDRYNIASGPLWNGSTEQVDSQAFITQESQQELKIQGIYASLALKDLAGRVVYEYLEKHCRVKLGGEMWKSTKAPGNNSGKQSKRRKRKKSAS
ncbi:hypothetical protein LCGC14_0430630 [marine sediment metagenome]|uniref:Uncharacterized protein n=1 Tax=marine sediment metagenome TaxID=412755 RepID=A0A0F9SN89_9ZZZZ